MSNRMFFGLVFLAAAVVMGWFAISGKPLPLALPNLENAKIPEFSTQPTVASQNGVPTNAGGVGLEKGGGVERVVVTYTDAGFGPNTLTVSIGTTVTFVNESNTELWVASGVYPSNQLLPDFNQKASVSRGGTYEYTFKKVGTWQYQNDKQPDTIGYIIVR